MEQRQEKAAIRLAIVDDEEAFQKQIRDFLIAFAEKNGYFFQIRTYNSGLALINDTKTVFDLVFLDVQMPHFNGIETAKALRERDSKVAIVFITNFVQFAPEGYQVHALDYILKPINRYDFEMKLKKGLATIGHEKETNQSEYLALSKKEGMVRLAFSDIRYLESVGHTIVFHVGEKEVTKYGPLRRVAPLLPKDRFLQINNCQIINMAYVTRIDKMKLFLGNDIFVISHPKKKEVMERLSTFSHLEG